MANVSSVVDGLFFGYIFTLVLLGIIIVQYWIYVHNNHDAWTLRAFVSGLILLDFAETACTTQLVHHYLISHFGDDSALKSPTYMITIDFAITNITFFTVHLFFANRLWKLGRSWYLPAVVVITSTAMLAMGASAISEQILGRLEFVDFRQHRIMIELTIFHALSVMTDFLITAGLSWSLSTTQSGFKSTRMVLRRLLAFTVTRGVLVCLVQFGHILMYVLDPRNMLFWIPLHLVLTKLYVLSTLVTLNSRGSLRAKLQEVDLGDFHISFAPSACSHADDAVAARHCQRCKTTEMAIQSHFDHTGSPERSTPTLNGSQPSSGE